MPLGVCFNALAVGAKWFALSNGKIATVDEELRLDYCGKKTGLNKNKRQHVCLRQE